MIEPRPDLRALRRAPRRHRALSIALLWIPVSAAAAFAQDGPAADSLPLWEHRPPNAWTIHYRRIAARFPELSAVHITLPCKIKFLIRDTSAVGPAQEALRPMLVPDCAELQAVEFPYSRSELESYRQMVQERLADADADARVRFDAGQEKIIALVRNEAARGRAASRLSNAWLPPGLVLIESPRDGIADDPHPPPPEAYVPVLNYVARHWPEEGDSVPVRSANLPVDFGPAHLSRLPATLVDEKACPALAVEFLPPTQLEDGTFRISLLRVSRRGGLFIPGIFHVRCVSGDCYVSTVTAAIADYMRHACGAE